MDGELLKLLGMTGLDVNTLIIACMWLRLTRRVDRIETKQEVCCG